MPGGWPIGLELSNAQAVGAFAGSSQGTEVDASASNNTKGSWVQLVASTTYDACMMRVMVQYAPPVSTASTGAIDIGIGSSGNEIVLVPNLICLASSAALNVNWYDIPVVIPSGTRIAARSQASTGTGGFFAVSVTLLDGAFTQIEGYSGVDAVGFSAGTTLGASVNPGGSINTKGSYTQLVASSNFSYAGFLLGFDLQNVSPAQSGWLLDIAIGTGGQEQIILPNVALWSDTASKLVKPSNAAFLPIPIPVGTRMAARCSCQAASQLLGVTLYGVYQ